MRRKKILYCESNTDGTLGGSYFSLFYLVERLDKSQYEPVVVFYRDNDLRQQFHERGIKTVVFTLPTPVRLYRKQGSWNRSYSALSAVGQKAINFFRFLVVEGIKYAGFLRKNDIDIVHLNNSVVRNHSWMLAALLTGRTCLTHERGINDYFPRLARFFGARLDAIVCISEAVKANMVGKGLDEGNLIVIHNGLDPDRLSIGTKAAEMRARYGIAQHAPVIGMVGNVKEWKGQAVVVDATAGVRRKFPDLKCVFVGDTAAADRYYRERLDKQVAALELNENVIFTGYQRQIADFVNMMDVVVHASVAPEPFGRVLIEAMALKKPLVGPRAGAVPEIVEEGVTGELYTPGDAKELADRLVRLLEDSAKTRAMGEAAYERVRQEFHIETNVRRTEELYARLCQKGGTVERAGAKET